MIKKLLIIIVIFLTSSCGFKVINYSDLEILKYLVFQPLAIIEFILI